MHRIVRLLLSVVAIAGLLFISFVIYFRIALEGCCGAPSNTSLFASDEARLLKIGVLALVNIALIWLLLRWGLKRPKT